MKVQPNELKNNQNFLQLSLKLKSIEYKICEMKKISMNRKEQRKLIVEQYKQKQDQMELKQQLMKDKEIEEERVQLQLKINKSQLHGLVNQVSEPNWLVNQISEPNTALNPYSARHNQYYISEIVKDFQDKTSPGREHIINSLDILKSLQKSMLPSKTEIKSRILQLPVKPGYENRITLVFDLDETLIHCNANLEMPHDIKISIPFQTGEVVHAGVCIRPYAKELLQSLSTKFQIIIFTASQSCYANEVLKHLDPKQQLIHHRLYRQHCYLCPENFFIKDLRIINRKLSRMLLIDNAAYSYAYQIQNGIPIIPYFHGSNDYELQALEEYVLSLQKQEDVRIQNRNWFQIHRYRQFYKEPARLVQDLYLHHN